MTTFGWQLTTTVTKSTTGTNETRRRKKRWTCWNYNASLTLCLHRNFVDKRLNAAKRFLIINFSFILHKLKRQMKKTSLNFGCSLSFLFQFGCQLVILFHISLLYLMFILKIVASLWSRSLKFVNNFLFLYSDLKKNGNNSNNSNNNYNKFYYLLITLQLNETVS